jgi:hypothetical protein
MAVTGEFSEHLAPGLREIVGTRLGGRETIYSRLLRTETSARNFEDYLAGAGLPVATLKAEGDNIDVFDPLEGKKIRVTFETYAIGMEVSQEAMEDDLYKGSGSALVEAGNNMADSLAEAAEIQFNRFFNTEAFATSSVVSFMRTLPDNSSTVSIFNTAHNPVSGGEVGTQTNRPATDVDLTLSSFRTALIQFRRYKDDRAKRIPNVTRPNRLAVPPELEYDAREIVGNPTRTDTANDIQNVTRGAVEVVPNPYMDDTDSWVLLAPLHWLIALWRRRPDMDSFDDRRARVSITTMTQRIGKVAVHWLGTYGSPGG